MKIVFLSLCLVLAVSCQQPNPDDQLEKLQGYWNIDTVVQEDGTVKEFPFSNHMDFFEIQENVGTKSRVSPTYDGSFIVYGDPIKFVWEIEEDKLILRFRDGEQSYSQEVKKVSNEVLQLVHENGMIYNYKIHRTDEEQ
jgi:hypothetical protein